MMCRFFSLTKKDDSDFELMSSPHVITELMIENSKQDVRKIKISFSFTDKGIYQDLNNPI